MHHSPYEGGGSEVWLPPTGSLCNSLFSVSTSPGTFAISASTSPCGCCALAWSGVTGRGLRAPVPEEADTRGLGTLTESGGLDWSSVARESTVCEAVAPYLSSDRECKEFVVVCRWYDTVGGIMLSGGFELWYAETESVGGMGSMWYGMAIVSDMSCRGTFSW